MVQREFVDASNRHGYSDGGEHFGASASWDFRGWVVSRTELVSDWDTMWWVVVTGPDWDVIVLYGVGTDAMCWDVAWRVVHGVAWHEAVRCGVVWCGVV
jgi:hypothetical protein